MQHYLLIYNRHEGRIIRQLEFTDATRALAARFAAEREFREAADIEIVVLGAESLAALGQTHARYFKSVQQLAEDALERLGELA
ncbi:MAG TPA: hypothetical protein VLG68_02070 [Gammaproteobacteria bacterium]|nr:hypothetical protein [Gammaproteobacteria bacterium]